MYQADPRFVMPSRKHLSYRLLPERYAATLARIISNLESVSVLSVTVDVWTNRTMKSFLGMTVHYILNWEMKYITLLCNRLTGRHTAENVLEKYCEALVSFKITD